MGTTVFTDGTNFTGAVGKYYDKKMIEQLMPKLVLYEAAEKRSLPLNQGNVIQFYKIKEFTTAMNTVTEGDTRGPEELSAKAVTATLKQRFAWHQVSDIVDLTAVNPVVNSAIEPISDRAARSVDKEILWRLFGATAGASWEIGDPFCGSAMSGVVQISDILDGTQSGLSTLYISSDGTQPATTFNGLINYLSANTAASFKTNILNMSITARTVRAVVAKLWSNNAQPADGALFDGVAHPVVFARLQADEDFIRWNQFANPEKGAKGVIGEFGGVKWVPSQHMPLVVSKSVGLSAYAGTASAVNFSGYLTLIYGTGAFAVTELTGKGGVKVIVKTPGPNDTSNPGDLYSTVGAKVTMAAAVLEPRKAYFLLTLETGLA